jgi:hypothetical protein
MMMMMMKEVDTPEKNTPDIVVFIDFILLIAHSKKNKSFLSRGLQL